MNQSPSFPAYARRLLDFIQQSSFHEPPLGVRTVLSAQTNQPADKAVRAPSGIARDDDFNQLALDLFRLQFEQVEPYRRLCASLGITPLNVGHWTEIPPVPTAAFKEFEMTSLTPSERTHVFHSSGTTEQRPSRHFHDAASLDIYAASLKPWFAQHVLSDDDEPLQMVFLTPPPEHAPHSSLIHMLQVVGTAFGGPGSYFAGSIDTNQAWTLDGTRVFASLHDATLAARPVILLGTAFSFVHLLDEFVAQNLRLQLPAGSRVMETGGYKGRSRQLPKPELHAMIRERMGVSPSHIICEYGMSEFSSQAYVGTICRKETNARSASPGFEFPPWARAIVASPETGRPVAVGEQGLIRICDLANLRSVLAIQTDDLAVRMERGFELLGRSSLSEPRGCSLMAS